MRKVAEAHRIADVCNLLTPRHDELVGGFQTAPDEPFARRKVAYLGEVALERSQAAPRIACNLVHREIVHVVLVQVIEYVYLPRLYEVEQRCKEVLVGIEQDVQPFGHLQLQHFFRRLRPGVEIRHYRLEQAAYVGPSFRQQVQARLAALRLAGYVIGIELAVKLAKERPRELQNYRAVGLAFLYIFLQPHAVVAAHEGATAFLQNGFPALVVYLQPARTYINERMFAVLMRATAVVREITCNEHVGTIKHIQLLHSLKLFPAKILFLFPTRFVVRLILQNPTVFLRRPGMDIQPFHPHPCQFFLKTGR